jgi:hypothetical protein
MTRFDDAAIAADYDDMKIDEFANAMKAKMAKKRDEGRGGWDDPAQCSVDHLAGLLLSHIDKGDPIDIANFCMMLFHRNGSKAIQQAVRSLYTEQPRAKQVVKIVAKAIHESLNTARIHTSLKAPWEAMIPEAEAALRAAGVQFKEET